MRKARRSALVWFGLATVFVACLFLVMPFLMIPDLPTFFTIMWSAAGFAYALGCMCLAASKGRSGLVGLIGLLFPLGLVYLIWMKPLPRPEVEKTVHPRNVE